MIQAFALAAFAAAHTCALSAALGASQSQPPLVLAAMAAPQTGSMASTVDPNAALADMQSTVRDLIAKNHKGDFGLSAAESARVSAALSGMSRDLANLQDKYRATPGKVDRIALDNEVEAVLQKNHGHDKSLILSLRSKDITTKGHECENFCWTSCGHNSVGDWVCFLSCRRQCGGA